MMQQTTTTFLLVALVLSATAQAQECVCQVRGTAFLRESADSRLGTHQFDCVAAPGVTAMTTIALDVDMESDFYVRNEPAYRAGKWFIQFDCDWIEDGNRLPGDKNDQVTPLSMSQVESLYNTVTPAARRLRGGPPQDAIAETTQHHHNRRRLSNVGKQRCGLVIVNTLDAKNPLRTSDGMAQAENFLYNKASNQFRDCSNGAMELVKADETIVIDLPKKASEYTSNTINGDMQRAICQAYGYPETCEISKERELDHILFSVPFGLSDDNPGSFWAYASAGDDRRFSVYGGGSMIIENQFFEGGFLVPSTIMHELGHNYRLGHALDPRENGFHAYGDKTTHMGGGSETKKCYNGYNYYVLGWHKDQTNEIVDLTPNVARMYNVKGINNVATGGIVNIKADKYFVTFNLKKGINGGIDGQGIEEDYTDEVIIHEGKDIHFGQSISAAYTNTQLVGNLKNVGDEYSVAVANGNLRMKLCSIDTTGSNGAMVSIGIDQVACGSIGGIHHPQGMRSLTAGSAVTDLSGDKDDILEFIMEIPYQPDSVTCETSGGSGDVDLVVNFMSSPQVLYAAKINACYSRGSTTAQKCTTTAAKGRYAYVTVEGDDPFSGVSLKCTVQGGSEHPATLAPTPQAPIEELPFSVLQSGVPKTNLAIAVGSAAFFTMTMPSNAESVSCAISGGSGDADLYTRWDNDISFSNRALNSCAPYLPGSEEVCDATKHSPLGTVLHVGVDAFRKVQGLTLRCDIVTSTVATTSMPTTTTTKPTTTTTRPTAASTTTAATTTTTKPTTTTTTTTTTPTTTTTTTEPTTTTTTPTTTTTTTMPTTTTTTTEPTTTTTTTEATTTTTTTEPTTTTTTPTTTTTTTTTTTEPTTTEPTTTTTTPTTTTTTTMPTTTTTTTDPTPTTTTTEATTTTTTTEPTTTTTTPTTTTTATTTTTEPTTMTTTTEPTTTTTDPTTTTTTTEPTTTTTTPTTTTSATTTTTTQPTTKQFIVETPTCPDTKNRRTKYTKGKKKKKRTIKCSKLDGKKAKAIRRICNSPLAGNANQQVHDVCKQECAGYTHNTCNRI